VPPLGTLRERARDRAVAAAREAGHSPRHEGHPGVSDRAYDAEESEFLRACAAHRQERHLPFLSPVDCLAVLKSLGYRKDD
jgi:hypothetical protein